MDVLTTVDQSRIERHLEAEEFFWLDLQAPADDELSRVGELLGLHALALEDTRELGQRPKVDVYADHILVVFYTARVLDDDPECVARALEVHVYVSGSFVMTVRRERCHVLDRLHETLAPAGTEEEDYLVYRIFDTLTDAWYPAVTAIEDQIDALEAQVLARTRREQLGSIYRKRQEVREHYRLIADQRDHFKPAAEAIRSLAGLSRGAREYLRDVGDHLAQLAGEFNRQNDDLMALAQTYFNANADRLSAVATRLTVLGTLFLSWTLVTGFFGQNFEWLVSHVETLRDFLVFGIGGLVVPTVALLALFWVKRHDWF